MNKHRTCTDGSTERTQAGSRPVRYELIDKDGVVFPGKYRKVTSAIEAAALLWPDQQQDPDETGAGWNIRARAL